MMTATDELLPCPFCGGQPDFQHFNITPNVRGRIICTCGIELRQGKNDTEDDMRVIWNTRSDYAVQAANERKAAQAIAATVGCGTCHIEERHGDWYCTGCGEMIGTCDTASELFIDGNAVSLWKFCPNCGRKVVDDA